MLCCSPDFTHPDPEFRRRQVDHEKQWIEMAAGLGAKYCRVLSGQRRPEVSVDEGLRYVVECIEACFDQAAACGVTLILENHYKDNYWEHPEFAQKMDVFCRLVDQIDSPQFGINYDPSNTYLAGEDPLELLRRVKNRVVTMHASDRYLAEGTLEDLRREEDVMGYAQRLRHGTIGQGLNDYDSIFRELSDVGRRGRHGSDAPERGVLAGKDRRVLAGLGGRGRLVLNLIIRFGTQFIRPVGPHAEIGLFDEHGGVWIDALR